MTNDPVNTYAESINLSWAAVKSQTFETAARCAAANATLTPSQKAELHLKLKMNKTTFSHHVKVGNMSVVECFETVFGVIERTLSAHLV